MIEYIQTKYLLDCHQINTLTKHLQKIRLMEFSDQRSHKISRTIDKTSLTLKNNYRLDSTQSAELTRILARMRIVLH
jgi:hypothetical protein